MATYLLIILITLGLSTSWTESKECDPKCEKVELSVGIPKGHRQKQIFKKIGSKYYSIIDDPKTWYTAVHKCHAKGGQLISLTDSVTLAEIRKASKNINFWIDLNDFGEHGKFVSISSGEKASFLDWCQHETSANVTSGNCVNIDNINFPNPCLKLASCLDFNSYICESQIPRSISIYIE
ncbi:C-type lectin 37Db-like [Drosophila albomicans]|uniref:C-type lectin 37Db-like n=1 Tax=Drosophila albomicans TaxID=7291 RepID=A0A6P8WC33_DROAB|nr:C-type lectin 37Db-like [Drosophila albomicans]